MTTNSTTATTSQTTIRPEETERPEWWDEDDYGEREEHRIWGAALARHKAGREYKAIHAMTTMLRAERLQQRIWQAHEKAKKAEAKAADQAYRNGTTGTVRSTSEMIEAAEARTAEATYHADQMRLWAQAEADAETEEDAAHSAVQKARHENKAESAADQI